jgi:filamentous hemagglutinin
VRRFISEDPLGFGGGDVNLYAYVMENPVNFIDPLGLSNCDPGAWEGCQERCRSKAVGCIQVRILFFPFDRVYCKSEPWKPGDDMYTPTRQGNPPSDRTVGRRFWKNEAQNPSRSDYRPQDCERMRRGLPPRRYNPDKPGMESMERSHEPIPERGGGTEMKPRWPQEHEDVDPMRKTGYPWE